MAERRPGVLQRVFSGRGTDVGSGQAAQVGRATSSAPASPAAGDVADRRQSPKLGYLSEQEIFRDLSPAEMDQIARETAMRTCRPGQVFYEPGQTGEALFLLKQGKVALYRLSPEGRKLVTAILGPGTFFGEMSVIGQGMYDSFAEAAEASTLCVMSRADVERLLLAKPRVALRLLEVIGRRLVEAEGRLEESAFKDVPARLASLLLRLAREQGSPSEVTGLSHQDLADSLGIYRETATAALDRLKEAGLVGVGRRRIAILRPDDLRALAER